jgi:hypothetical protein
MKTAHTDQQMFALDQGTSCHGRFRGGDLPGKATGCRKFHDLLLTRACSRVSGTTNNFDDGTCKKILFLPEGKGQ